MKPVAALLALALPLAAAAQPVAFHDAGGIAYACGGVGSDERRALETLRRNASLELLFVTAKRGGYTAGTQVVMTPVSGGAPASFRAGGPTCVVRAPAGRYRIEATLDGHTRAASVQVPARGKAARVVMTFPDEAGDDIRASDEEKREAAEP